MYKFTISTILKRRIKNKSLIADYAALKKAILSDPTLAADISTLSGQLEFTGVISHYESETSSYFSALGGWSRYPL